MNSPCHLIWTRVLMLRVLVIGLVAASVAGAADPEDIRSTPLSPRSRGAATMFTQLGPGQTGIEFQNHLDAANTRRYLYNGAGTCIGDYDGDGLPDVYLVCQDGKNRLYRNLGGLKFEDVTAKAGVDGGTAWGTGASFVDIDNDGDLDLYACNTAAANLLYVNQGDGTFVESAAAAGLDHRGASTMAAFADYDRDGDLDLYLLTNRVYSVQEENPQIKLRLTEGQLSVHPEFREQYFILNGQPSEAGQRDILFQNNGDGTFSDVTAAAGVEAFDMGLSATWWDYDNDGWLDLYVGNDMKTPDHCYRNLGDGTFRDMRLKAMPHTAWFSMGADFGDVNNDGWFDFFSADMSSTTHFARQTTMGAMNAAEWFLTNARPPQYARNAFYINTQTPRFLEAAYLSGIDSTGWTWSAKFGDLDNDGKLDLFLTTGMIRNVNDSDTSDRWRAMMEQGRKEEAAALLQALPPLKQENLAYRNLGAFRFESVGASWGLNHLGVSHGAAFGDLDRDGDLDLVVNHLEEPVGIYRNDAADGHRLVVRLAGLYSNRYGVGARVTIESDSGRQVRQLTLARGYLSADEPVLHFGLGPDTTIKRLTVDWPTGSRQVVENLAADQLVTISENAHTPTPPPAQPERLFQVYTAKSRLRFLHQEDGFDDYARQPLLPYQPSRLGPGLAWGDADGDGRNDVFFGGAAGQAGALYRATGSGQFELVTGGPWENDTDREDMGLVWFDADADGDFDLYAASGGAAADPQGPAYGDRLYLNDGNGGFTKATADVLPNYRDSSGMVSAADFDRDGDLDLFVAGRILPGRYPTSSQSRLLRNDAGRFVDVADSIAGGFADAGLVTAALWSDIDNDGFVDLLLAVEWGPITVFRNEGGHKLVNHTAKSGLATHSGWWNSITGTDLDGDGDIDYVVGNAGLNTRYHATPQRPVELFAGDFDKDGRLDVVEAQHEGKSLYPVRTLSASAQAMPFLHEKFKTNKAFATASLEEIYGTQHLSEARRLVANRLDHVVLLNDGQGHFRIEPLPYLTQIAPAYGLALGDYNADGRADLLMAQNFHAVQPETGRWDGGIGQLLSGDGKGGFIPIGPRESAIAVRGDQKGLATCDLDGNGWVDFVMTLNSNIVPVFRNRAVGDHRSVQLTLSGKPGNPTGVGARVTAERQSGLTTTTEVFAGSGYLSQSAPDLFIGVPAGDTLERITVRWGDGTQSRVTAGLDKARITVTQK